MPILKVPNSTEKYRQIAIRLKTPNELSGRGLNRALTELRADFICDNIMKFSPSCCLLLDIGCGDGSFLVNFSLFFSSLIGILPTKEEVRVVKSLLRNYQKIKIMKGFSVDIPLADCTVDVLICNSVLHGVGFDSESVDQSLKEFRRVLKHNGILYIGEIPELNEFSGRNYGTSIIKFLIYYLKCRGFHEFIEQVKSLAKAFFTSTPYIIQPTKMFYETRALFASRLEKHGFDVNSVFETKTNRSVSMEEKSQDIRLDYLCKLQ